MAQFTKKYMAENYERLYRHADVLELYLYDTQMGVKPAATEKHRDEHSGVVRVQLYRATSASGGYVAVLNGNTNVFLLDDINQRMRDEHSVYSLGLRLCLERITVLRNKIANGEVSQ